jgi:uncharacterized protein (TIGR00730 family)
MTLSICVYCGSRFGNNPNFKVEAENLGRLFAQNKMRLVYGAGDVGLMGAIADATMDAGGEVMGVIPEHLFSREVGKSNITTYVVTENMHERKKVMFMNADASVILPGGAGTLDEFFEVLTWRQIGIHTKPIFVLNVDGYWDGLSTLIQHQIDHGFADASILSYFEVHTSAQGIIDALAQL